MTKYGRDDVNDVGPTLDARNASSPFDKPTADIILRSSDLIDFYVRKAILAEASTSFDRLFRLPPPSGANHGQREHRNGIPVITMDEDSETLDLLLRICYPGRTPSIIIDNLHRLMIAAAKHSMDAVVEVAKDRMHALATESPLRVYAIALLCGLKEEAKFAARCSLAHSVRRVYAPEFEELTAGAYYRLLDYHMRCSDAITPLVDAVGTPSYGKSMDRAWVFVGNANHPGSACARTKSFCIIDASGGQKSHRATAWWWNHLAKLKQATEGRPSGQAVLETGVDDVVEEASVCNICRVSVAADMRAFNEFIAAEIDEATSQLELDILDL